MLAAQKHELCVTTDAVVQGVHFSLPWFSFEDVGHKALAVNLSDLAAMGAVPSWFQCAVAMPASVTAAEVRSLARGMAKLSKQHGCALSGGNFTRATELSITLTAAGTVPPGSALLRSGAKPGDALYVSGTLGDAALALNADQRSRSDDEGGMRALDGAAPLVLNRRPASARTDRQRRPVPRVALGLIARRYAHAAIDVSDGLLQDLAHVCRASSVRAEVDAAKLPLSRAVRSAGEQGLSWALTGGEDYELLLAVPPSRTTAFERACAAAGEKVIPIGVFTKGSGIHIAGAPPRLVSERAGHDHFIDALTTGD